MFSQVFSQFWTPREAIFAKGIHSLGIKSSIPLGCLESHKRHNEVFTIVPIVFVDKYSTNLTKWSNSNAESLWESKLQRQRYSESPWLSKNAGQMQAIHYNKVGSMLRFLFNIPVWGREMSHTRIFDKKMDLWWLVGDSFAVHYTSHEIT